jgi:hypothetical protein
MLCWRARLWAHRGPDRHRRRCWRPSSPRGARRQASRSIGSRGRMTRSGRPENEPWKRRVTRSSGPDGKRSGAILTPVSWREHEHGAGMTPASRSRRWKPAAPPWQAVGARAATCSATGCARWARTWGRWGSIRRPQQHSKNVGCARCGMSLASIRAQSHRSTGCSATGTAGCPRSCGWRGSPWDSTAARPLRRRWRCAVSAPRSVATRPWRPPCIAWALVPGPGHPGGPPGWRVGGIRIVSLTARRSTSG